MFKKLMYSAGCAAVAVMCVCEGAGGMEVLSSCYNDPLYKQYVSDFDIWQKDGERFMTDSFISECKDKGALPILNDGRPELPQWLGYTNLGYVFQSAGWPFSVRDGLAKPFIQRMYDTYTKEKMPEACLISLRKALFYLIPEDEY